MTEEMGLPSKVACIGLVAGIAICFWQLTTGNLTSRETILFSSALAVLSIAASWFVSKHYSEQSYTKNLQTFGRKASEKVNNLSNELNKLTAFLQQELEPDEGVSSSEALLAKRMKIEAAIHMVGTLKSINEGSLSDWQAVIGDEIVEQKEKQEEKEETLRDILEMMKTLPATAPVTERTEPGEEDAPNLQKEIDSIRSEMRVLATQVSGVPIKNAEPKNRKERVERKCPKCDKLVVYSQRTRNNSIKAFSCPHCGISLVSRVFGGTFALTERMPVEEKLECPSCKSVLAFSLDPLPGSTVEIECKNCKAPLKATRRATLIRLRFLEKGSGIEAPSQLSEELLSRIKEAMGKQPWPTGRARQISNQLNISHAIINRALQVLISRGDFDLQQNGKLYAPLAHPSS
jgi:predicted RNA-binding Zn-ribbon protein involved in translation (DUF1610 family)